MIKIIKEGRKPKKLTPIYTIKCPLCGCIFECETSDFHSLSRGLDGTFTIFCPCCNMIIEDSVITADIKFVEDAVKLEGETSNLTANNSPVATVEFADVTIEEAYKEGIRNALDWLMEPQNEWEKDENDNQTYIISRCEIEEFAKMKEIK